MFLLPHPAQNPQAIRPPQHLVFVMLDGVRWQEVFDGASPTLLEDMPPSDPHVRAYAGASRSVRRTALLPFLWGSIAAKGQILGNQDKGSRMHVRNSLNFSYPGYAETLCGFVDPAVAANADVFNPNPTVLEWMQARSTVPGEIAAFTSWHTFRWILREPVSHIKMAPGLEPLEVPNPSPQTQVLNHLKREMFAPGEMDAPDAITFWQAHIYLTKRHPKLLFIQLSETDAFGHKGDYRRYLDALHQDDEWLGMLWETIQSDPEYAGSTTLLVTTDHGRGSRKDNWWKHGEDRPGSHFTWLAAIGPEVPPLGEIIGGPQVENAQVAATVAALLGENYADSDPRIAPPIQNLLPRSAAAQDGAVPLTPKAGSAVPATNHPGGRGNR